MKPIILAFLMALAPIPTLGAEGVFYVDKPVEAHFIAQSGATTTNRLSEGSSTVVGATLIELCPSEKTTVYFGPLMVQADAGSVMTVNTFDQEVKNLTNSPCLAAFGSHNLSLGLNKGNFAVTYAKQDESSTCAVSTPLALYQMNVGKFLFQITDAKSLVYVLDGMMTVHGDKNRVDSAKKGSKSITGQIDTEIATTTRPINQAENSTLAGMQTRDNASAIQFFVIDGRVRGVRMTP